MSTPSSEEVSRLAPAGPGHLASCSGKESLMSIPIPLPLDINNVHTKIIPPASPTPSDRKVYTSGDILEASRHLEHVSLQRDQDLAPTGILKEVLQHASESSRFGISMGEAGCDADADENGKRLRDGDGNENRNVRRVVDTTAQRFRRPAFLRIDTRQHRRVASLLATGRPTSPGFGDANAPRWPHPELPRSLGLAKSDVVAGNYDWKSGRLESYELQRRSKVEPVGLGIGFPENHPLRSRAFTMPIPISASPVSDTEGDEEKGQDKQEQRSVPSALLGKWKKPTGGRMYSPSPVRVSLRPAFLEAAPSPMDPLPAQANGVTTFRRDDTHHRLEREHHCARIEKGRVKLDLS